MLPIRKIAFPVSFSTNCRTAAGYIADIANRFDAELHRRYDAERWAADNAPANRPDRRQGSARSQIPFPAYGEHRCNTLPAL
jgi:hypothetical protein